MVIGYGQQKKETLTGSISQVKGEDLVRSPQPNVSNSLTGRFSGIIANNRSGEPGYDNSDIYIRGLATTGNRDVLVVVDGIPGQLGGLSRLNPNDIESISVLKDASATAIYGSRGANGVIMVTTKKGKLGKTQINFNSSYSVQNEINRLDLLNADQFTDYIAEARPGFQSAGYNTDWQDQILQTGAIQDHNLSMSGANDDANYFISGGYTRQDGTVKKTDFERFSFRVNSELRRGRLTLGENISGAKSHIHDVIAPRDNLFDKTVSNMQEVAARDGKIILVSDADPASIGCAVQTLLPVPSVHPFVTPLVYPCADGEVTLIAPTGSPAWPIDLVNGDHFMGASASPAAIAGYPNVTVPAGYVEGLPVGISFFGRAWTDAKLIGLAYAYEQATKHRRPPTFIPSLPLR